MLGTDGDDSIAARAVMLAAGAGAFGPNRPPLPGLAAFEATGAAQYYVRRSEDLRGANVVIAGGGDYFVHRRPKFRAAPESAAQLHAAAERGEIELVIP